MRAVRCAQRAAVRARTPRDDAARGAVYRDMMPRRLMPRVDAARCGDEARYAQPAQRARCLRAAPQRVFRRRRVTRVDYLARSAQLSAARRQERRAAALFSRAPGAALSPDLSA